MYYEKVRPHLTSADKGKYVVVNVDTGEYEIDPDNVAVLLRAQQHLGEDVPLFSIRAGYRVGAVRGKRWEYVEEAGW